MPHTFGGAWTEVKLDAVQYYLECYTKALTRAGMDLWYVDGFAGSGDRTATREAGGLFDGPIETVTEILDGSARRALKVHPPFNHYVFIERDQERARCLQGVARANPTADVRIIQGDANKELIRLASNPPWNLASRSRGVVFLDPYALHVDWATLVALSLTRALDVWYLFPIRDLTRQLANRMSGIGTKERKLDKMLGSEWREMYDLPPASIAEDVDLFDTRTVPERQRQATWRQIEAWFKQRLETIFPLVSEPVPILHDTGRQTFSLFLGVSNPAKAATDLAKHFLRHVKKHYDQPAAFRQRSGR